MERQSMSRKERRQLGIKGPNRTIEHNQIEIMEAHKDAIDTKLGYMTINSMGQIKRVTHKELKEAFFKLFKSSHP